MTGTHPLLRASLRHDGRRFAPWIAVTTALAASSVLVYPLVFPTEADRQALAATIGGNPALGLIFGPAYDVTTPDGFTAWRSLALGGFLAGLGAIFTVVRATRAQEDSGQAELLASGVMSRSARLTVAVTLALVGSLLLGVVVAAATVVCGGAVGSSVLLAATMTATGWMCTGLAAVTAQLGSEARAASTMAVGTLGTLFLLRGFAYAMDLPAWTVWANPLGWMTETKPAVADVWWPLALAAAVSVCLLGAGFVLQARRDFGLGAIPPRPGPARGAVRSPWRLAVRLHRGPLVTWALAFVALGFVFGYFTRSVDDILQGDATVQRILASGALTPEGLVGAFLVTVMSLVGILASVPGVQTVVKVRSEELSERVEPVLAAAVGRPRYLGANVLLALLLPTVCLLVAGSLVAALAATADIGVTLADGLVQAAVTAPAVWTVVALSVLVVGARPQVLLAAWAGVAASFALTILGPTFELPEWALGISPFWHVPTVTSADPDWTGVLWVLAVAVLFLAAGFVGFRRRDLAR